MIDGAGDPNTSPAYAAAISALYTLSYTLKFMGKAMTPWTLKTSYWPMPVDFQLEPSCQIHVLNLDLLKMTLTVNCGLFGKYETKTLGKCTFSRVQT